MHQDGNCTQVFSNKAISKVWDIDIQIGRTGALTPVAKINL